MTDEPPPLRVLHLASSLEPGGVSRYLLRVGRGLCAAGHGVSLAAGPGAWRDRVDAEAWRTLHVPMHAGPIALWQSARRVRRFAEQQQVQLIHAHHRRAGLVGRRVARALRIPMLVTLHLTGVPMRGPRRWLSDFGDMTHAPSEAARRWLIEAARVDAQRIVTVPHGIDPAAYPRADNAQQLAARRALDLPDDAPVAAYVGRFEHPKHEQWMLDVADAARSRSSGLRVVLMGDGPRAQALRAAVARRGLGERVRVLAWGEPMQLYQACDALMLPSSAEGFPLVCVEAMSVGRALLRTRTAGCEEQVIEGRTGHTCPIDREAFVEAALGLMSDRAALARMGEEAAAHVRERFTFDRQLERTVGMYRALLTR